MRKFLYVALDAIFVFLIVPAFCWYAGVTNEETIKEIWEWIKSKFF